MGIRDKLKDSVMEFLDLKVTKAEMSPEPVAGSGVSDLAASIYYKIAALDTAVGYIASSISKCEFQVVENDALQSNDLYYKLNVRANPNQNAAQFWTNAIYRLILENEILIIAHRGWLYVADSFARDKIHLRDDRFRGVYVEGEPLTRAYKASDAIYLKYGNRRITTMLENIAVDYSRMMKAAISGYEKGAGEKYKLHLDMPSQGTLQDEANTDARYNDPSSMLQTFMKNANSVYMETEGQNLEEISIEGVAATDLINLRKDIFETIATVLKIPPPMMFGNMTNIKDISKVFLTYSIDPLAQQISAELTSKCFTQLEWIAGSRVRVDTTRINHIDIFEIAASISQLIGSGYSPNEIRLKTGDQLLEGEIGNEHLITRNFSPIDEVLREIATGGEK